MATLRYGGAIVALLVLGLIGCQWAQPPRASDQFVAQWEIREPTRTVDDAELFLTDEGFWGYRPTDKAAFEPVHPPGAMLKLEAESTTHYFAVAQSANWGYRLQRLDDRPLSQTLTGALRPVTAENAAQNEQLCLVEPGESPEERCDFDERHRRWHVFDVDSNEPAALQLGGDFERPRRGPGFPVIPAGLIGGDRLDSFAEVVADGAESHSSVAIAASERPETAVEARVAVDETCTFSLEDTSLVTSRTVDFAAYGVSASTLDHPLAVEDAALRLEADALVECSGDNPRLSTPVLSRRLLEHPDSSTTILGVAALGMKPRTMPDGVDAELIRAAALVAAGDHSAASFWLTHYIDDYPGGDKAREVGLVSMPIWTAAGRPELAIRAGNELTASSWNAENVPDYLDGLIALKSFFGDIDSRRDLLKHRRSLRERHFGARRTGWKKWTQVRVSIAEGRSSYGPGHRSSIEAMETRGLDHWALAIWATIQMQGLELPVVDEPSELDARFEEAYAGALWAVLRGDTDPLGCGDDDAGRCKNARLQPWRHIDDDPGAVLQTLHRHPVSEIRPVPEAADSLRAPPALQTPADRLQWSLGLAPLVDSSKLEAITGDFVAQLREMYDRQPEGICEARHDWKTILDRAVVRATAVRSGDAHRDWGRFVGWWRDIGLEAACGSPEYLLEAIRTLEPESNQWTRAVLPFLEDHVLRGRISPGDAELIAETVELAYRVGDYDTCARWSLGTAVGAARAGRFDTAEASLIAADRCLDSEQALRPTRDVVAQYVAFERGGGHRIVQHGAVEHALDRATLRRIDDPEVCAGLLPLGFQLEHQLPSSVIQIAQRVQFEAAPHGDFGLQTATNLLVDARSAYQSALRDLQRGRGHTAALALLEARDNFARVEHLPGLSRIQFLEETLFDGRLDEFAGDEDLDLQTPDDGQTRRLAAELDGPIAGDQQSLSELAIAALLIERRIDRLDELNADGASLPDVLCDPETLFLDGELVDQRRSEPDEQS